jgi:hypothetical protein
MDEPLSRSPFVDAFADLDPQAEGRFPRDVTSSPEVAAPAREDPAR